MKIINIYSESYRWPKPQVVTSGRGGGNTLYTHNSLVLVYIETDEGITGIGSGYRLDNLEAFKNILAGEDPLNIEKLYQMMTNHMFLKNHVCTISAIDIALWDLKAKAAKLPLYKLLGGVRSRLDCYVAGGYYAPGKTILDLQHEMEAYMKENAKAVKMKVGGRTPYEDAKRVHAVREVIGEETKLLVDANCGWRINEALEFAKMTENDRLFWFEEPLAAKDFEGFKTLAAHTYTPLAAGESLELLDDEVSLIDTGAIAFTQPDAGLCGGVSLVMKIGHYAEAKHINVAPHGSQQVHVHLNCALNNARITEFYSTTFNHLAYTAYQYPVIINSDGTVSPSEEPGANFDIDREVLEPYRIG